MVHSLIVDKVELLVRCGHEQQTRGDEKLKRDVKGAYSWLNTRTHEGWQVPERARWVGDTVDVLAASIHSALAVRITIGTILSILRCDKTDLDDARETSGHERISEDGMDL